MTALSTGQVNELAGGYVSFFGRVRAVNEQKKVSHLFYEAYVEMAQEMFFKLEQKAKARFDILECLAVHRLGQTAVNETAVAIMVASPHRQEAFLAARFLIDELKNTLPIWKKETYQDGSSVWDKGHCRCSHEFAAPSVFAPVDKALLAQTATREILSQKRVLLVGAGGLGCPMALNIAALGIKELHIYDGDDVAVGNLARQFMFGLSDIGKNKAWLMKRFLNERFLGVEIIAEEQNLCRDVATKILGEFDMVIEASDSQVTKKMLAQLAYEKAVPYLCASVYQLEGEVAIFSPQAPGCLWCFHKSEQVPIKTCGATGIFTHICGIVAGFGAEQALRILLEEKIFHNHLTLLEPSIGKITTMNIPKDDNCLVCCPKKVKGM